MTYTEALKAIASHSGYAQLAQLCAEDNPDHRKRDRYRGLVIRLATPAHSHPRSSEVKNAAMAAGRVVAAAATGQPVMAAPEVRAQRLGDLLSMPRTHQWGLSPLRVQLPSEDFRRNRALPDWEMGSYFRFREAPAMTASSSRCLRR